MPVCSGSLEQSLQSGVRHNEFLHAQNRFFADAFESVTHQIKERFAVWTDAIVFFTIIAEDEKARHGARARLNFRIDHRLKQIDTHRGSHEVNAAKANVLRLHL